MGARNARNGRPTGLTASLLGICVLATAFMARSSQNIFQVTYPLLGKNDVHLGASAIGMAAAGAMLASALASLWLARGHGSAEAGRVAIAGLFTMVIGFVAMDVANDLAIYILAAMVAGAGGGLTLPSLVALAGRSSPGNPGKGIARYTAVLSLSLLIGPLVEGGTLALTNGSLRMALAVFTPWPLIGIALIVYARRRADPFASPSSPRHYPDQPEEAGDTAGGDTAIGAEHQSTLYTHDPREEMRIVGENVPMDDSPSTSLANLTSLQGLSALWKSTKDGTARIRLPLLIQLAYQVPFVSIVAFGGLLAIDVDHASTGQVVLLFAAFYAISSAMRLLIAWKPPGDTRKTIVRASLTATVLGVTMLTAHSMGLLVGGFILLGFAHGTTYPISLTLLAEDTSPQDMVRNNARLATIQSFVGVVLPVVLGLGIGTIGFSATFGLVLIPVVAFGIPAWRWKWHPVASPS
ncbi:MAG: MFS transporter [Acidimicrobiales bacterium]